jgi:putative glutamine amidotransferase
MRPVIGLTSRTLPLKAAQKTRLAETVARAYVEPLEAAGALPLLLPNCDDPELAGAYLDLVDGVLLTGGDDPHPRVFGEAPHPRIDVVDERRDRFELALVPAARKRGLPVLGICRGAQLMNIALGGDIFQDVPSQTESPISHAQKTLDDGPWHDVEVAAGSRLAAVVGAGVHRVNSFHHQACRRLGEGLSAGATAVGDGLVEAVEDPAHTFFLGVQWHPEIGRRGPEEAGLALFRAFVEAARETARVSSKGRRTAVPG